MVIISEDIMGSKTESEEGALVPMAKNGPKQQMGGLVLFQRRNSVSVTLLRNTVHGAFFKLFQAPEMTRNFMPFPSNSQRMLCLKAPQRTSNLSKKASVQMIEWNNTEGFRTQISSTLKEVVKRAVMEFRLSHSCVNPDEFSNNDVLEAVPISFRPAGDRRNDPMKMDMVVSQRKRLTTLVVGETLICFKLPENCTFDPTDVDKLPMPEKRDQMMQNAQNNVRKYTFLQRLEGWKMERRQRANGRFDMYYYHQHSKRMFRSVTEVVNFLLYEAYPEKPLKSAGKEKIGGDDLSGKKWKKREGITPLKRKFVGNISPDYHHPIYDIGKDDKEAVEQFLADAYDNMMKLSEKKDTSFSFNNNEESGANDGNFNPKKTIEESLAEAYNNLLNYPSYHEPKMPKGKAKRSRSIEEPKRKEAMSVTQIPPSVSITPTKVDAMSIDQTEKEKEKEQQKEKDQERENEQKIEKDQERANEQKIEKDQERENGQKIEKDQEREREKAEEEEEEEEMLIDTVTSIPDSDIAANPITVEPSPADMEAEEEAAAPANTVGNKRFNIREVDGRVIFSDVEFEPNFAAGDQKGSSAMEVAKSVALSHMDECDLINHISESQDMFELALFLSNNRSNGGFI